MVIGGQDLFQVMSNYGREFFCAPCVQMDVIHEHRRIITEQILIVQNRQTAVVVDAVYQIPEPVHLKVR